MTEMHADEWYSEEAATFGDRLAAARDDAGLSQAALADRLGVKEATMAAWENDLKEPRANRLQMLSGMLNVSITWLLTGKGEGPTETETIPTEIGEILTEMRELRVKMLKSSEKLAQLEKSLRKALQDG